MKKMLVVLLIVVSVAVYATEHRDALGTFETTLVFNEDLFETYGDLDKFIGELMETLSSEWRLIPRASNEEYALMRAAEKYIEEDYGKRGGKSGNDWSMMHDFYMVEITTSRPFRIYRMLLYVAEGDNHWYLLRSRQY